MATCQRRPQLRKERRTEPLNQDTNPLE